MLYNAGVYIKDSDARDAYQMADINELVGFTLGDALKVVSENGYLIEKISITAPPKLELCEYDKSFRILRVDSTEGKSLSILVCKPL